jgi:hypothetical protein
MPCEETGQNVTLLSSGRTVYEEYYVKNDIVLLYDPKNTSWTGI